MSSTVRSFLIFLKRISVDPLAGDLVIASEKALFCLPEVKRGLCTLFLSRSFKDSTHCSLADASQGALNRLVRNIGRQRASEIALLGLPITPTHALHLGLINKIVPHDELLPATLEWAAEICKGSPDALRLTKMAFNASLHVADLEESVDWVNDSRESVELSSGDNVKEGMLAFVERREPRWGNSKL